MHWYSKYDEASSKILERRLTAPFITNQFIFAKDTKRDCGEKKFTILSFVDFLDLVQKEPNTSFHEIIQPHQQARLFFDLETRKGAQYTDQEWIALGDRLHEAIHEYCLDALKKDCGQPKYWDCHRQEEDRYKHSTHVIYDYWFANSYRLKFHLDIFFLRYKDEPFMKILDKAVYPLHGKRNFRMPYCCKFQQPSVRLLPRGLPQAFNPELFCQSLLTFYRHNACPSPYLPVVEHFEQGGTLPGDEFSDTNTAVEDIDQARMSQWSEGIVNWLKKRHQYVKEWKQDGTQLTFIVSPIVCPRKLMYHDNNKTMLNVKTDLNQAYWSCPDDACGFRWECETDLEAICFPHAPFDLGKTAEMRIFEQKIKAAGGDASSFCSKKPRLMVGL